MKRLILIVICAGLLTGYAAAQEIHTLTTPATVTTSTYALRYVGLDVAGNRIVVEAVSNTGVVVSKTYDSSTSPTGATLLHSLNTANFTVNSLVKAVFNRLIADGVIPAGSVSGTPQ
jgi:predicted anti-sigma-YlaC factor YlaD